jgi:hypothetical protein
MKLSFKGVGNALLLRRLVGCGKMSSPHKFNCFKTSLIFTVDRAKVEDLRRPRFGSEIMKVLDTGSECCLSAI